MVRRAKISPDGISVRGGLRADEKTIEMEKIRYIVLKKLLGATGRFRLGFLWVILEPMMIALIYVFLFSVINSGISGELIILGIGTYGVFSSSFRDGMGGLREENGGFSAEWVRTGVLIKAELLFSAIEGIIRAISMLILLAIAMEVSIPGSLFYLPICAILAVISKSVGYNLTVITKNSPDIRQLFDFIIRLMFFVTPVLYPFSNSKGIHRELNSYNPVTYFIEASRFVCGTVDEQMLPESPISIIFLTAFFILALRGVSKLDKYRWEVSTWN